ncbi:hypothetical protein PanWU01x14_248740 [Parasponia andersonii]|uniref:Uncharacterized protein n=1 Tax=Parasponia andersonii TaxID=3476 RepID=A0A2P5BDA3_PARAD|nr:hypothetical protein PanWU01x14_248740 [Parasponia andersonii]
MKDRLFIYFDMISTVSCAQMLSSSSKPQSKICTNTGPIWPWNLFALSSMITSSSSSGPENFPQPMYGPLEYLVGPHGPAISTRKGLCVWNETTSLELDSSSGRTCTIKTKYHRPSCRT